jgi:hypothetical protein
MALAASTSFQKDTSRIQRIQAQLDEAKEKGDAQAVARFSKEMLGSGTVDREVIDNVFYPMLVALAQQRGAQAIPPREVLKNNIRLGMDLFPITGYDVPEPSAEQRNTARQARAIAWGEQMAGVAFGPGEHDRFAHFLETGRNEWVRAAELQSPAPRGHFLRELGQSDRDLVENSNGDASVSHALIFMNGGLVARTVSAMSPVILRVRSGPHPAAQLELACLTLFSRRPTPHESEVFEKAPPKARTPEALVHALLNTRQFLFIQ